MTKQRKYNAGAKKARVRIILEEDSDNALKRTELPFVMAVMAPLAGKSEHSQTPIIDRKFMPIDIDNFDSRMKSIRPRIAFPVTNHLTGEGNLLVDISFESMNDFLPDAIATQVPALQELLRMRTQLANLLTWQDGKREAGAVLSQLIQDPVLLEEVAMRQLPGPAA